MGCEGLGAQVSEGVLRRQPANIKAFPSPWSLQYLGSRTSEKVKNKILELLYSWTVGLPEEVKIAEAYQMLKKQGEALEPPLLPSFPPPLLSSPPHPGSHYFGALAARSWVCPF